MTTELASHARFASYRIDSVVVPNGIDLDRITPLAPNSDERPRLALLGHPHSPWHGTDKLLDLAHRHPDWDIEVIGPVEADLGAPPPPNLRLHPELAEADYLPLLAKVDVGIGSLAMHRIGATENPALKVREYLARGLAVLTGCRDPDFPASTTFLLELPNVEANLRENDDAVTDFVHEWHGRRVDRTSVEHLDLRRKETQRLEFIHRVAAASGKRREKMVT